MNYVLNYGIWNLVRHSLIIGVPPGLSKKRILFMLDGMAPVSGPCPTSKRHREGVFN